MDYFRNQCGYGGKYEGAGWLERMSMECLRSEGGWAIEHEYSVTILLDGP